MAQEIKLTLIEVNEGENKRALPAATWNGATIRRSHPVAVPNLSSPNRPDRVILVGSNIVNGGSSLQAEESNPGAASCAPNISL